ncbi:hypothetical protein J2754_002178 [Halarchaeum solikamskense]|uniref:hypothetical protein n=1 Tax=Halarchaeum nitratireducens TaxID=489913 RepID=UPI001B3AA53E|nr:hypothetical protein [Halarchaeum solikamskense]MBP2251841.1 hypothetical protein [Halarchaeum solikamskense]
MPSEQSTLSSLSRSDNDDSSTSTAQTASPDNSDSSTSLPTPPSDDASTPVESETSTDTSATDCSGGPPANLDEEQITTLDASEELDEWTSSCETEELDYAYLHVQVDVYRTLTDTWWGLRITTQEKIIENPRNSYGGYVGQRCPDPDELVDMILSWVSSTLATPYLPLNAHDLPIGHHLRTIPSDRIRVFIADDAVDFLTERDIAVDEVLTALDDLEEHSPPSAYKEQAREYYAAQDTIDASRTRIRKLKQAIGAVFGISTGYGGKIPSAPPVEYASLSPNDLQDELETAREARQTAEDKRDTLKEELTSKQSVWADELKTTLTDRLHSL